MKNWVGLIFAGLLICYIILISILFVNFSYWGSEAIGVNQVFIFIITWAFSGCIGTIILRLLDNEVVNTTNKQYLAVFFGGVFTLVVIVPKEIYDIFQKSKN